MEKLISIEDLGKCEYCETIISIKEAVAAKWDCPKCGKELTNGSFGHKEVGEDEIKRIKWLGKGERWVRKRPTKDFNLGRWKVSVDRFLSIRYPIF